MKTQSGDLARKRLRAKIDDDIINQNIEIDPHDLPEIKIPRGREQDFLNAHAALCAKGCNAVTLMWALRLGRSARGMQVPSVPAAGSIKLLVKKLDSLAAEIEELEKTGFLMSIVREETDNLWEERRLGMEDIDDLGEILPHLDLQRWMRRKVNMYRRWLEIAALRIPPKSGTMLTRLEYLYPALYIREATGEMHVPMLLNLLSIIGICIDETQLSREFALLRRDYKWLLMDMYAKLYIVSNRTIG